MGYQLRDYEGAVRRLSGEGGLWLDSEDIDMALREYVRVPPGVLLIASIFSSLGFHRWRQGAATPEHFGVTDREAIARSDLVLVILHEDSHFSLLVYWRTRQTLFHYNTLPDYHKEYPVKMARALYETGIIGEFDDLLVRPDFIPVQEGGWECGYAVYFFCWIIFAANPPRPLIRDDFKERFPDLVHGETCLKLRRDLRDFFKERRNKLREEQSAKEEKQEQEEGYLEPVALSSLWSSHSIDYMRVMHNPFTSSSDHDERTSA